MILLSVSITLLFVILLAGICIPSSAYEINIDNCSLSPCLMHPFGTDWMGRDMFFRTLKGLSLSIKIGLTASVSSCIIAMFIGIGAAYFGKKVDYAITGAIDVMMGMPHLILLILISVLMGKGARGIVIGVVVTHWVSLARIVRAEVMQIRETQYVRASRSMGKSSWFITTRHILPAVFPQFVVGVILLFPHAILHEASVTFLGFGLSPIEPAIGIILSEAMGYLNTGMWWLAVFPGVSIVIIVRLFDLIGEQINKLIDPAQAQL